MKQFVELRTMPDECLLLKPLNNVGYIGCLCVIEGENLTEAVENCSIATYFLYLVDGELTLKNSINSRQEQK